MQAARAVARAASRRRPRRDGDQRTRRRSARRQAEPAPGGPRAGAGAERSSGAASVRSIRSARARTSCWRGRERARASDRRPALVRSPRGRRGAAPRRVCAGAPTAGGAAQLRERLDRRAIDAELGDPIALRSRRAGAGRSGRRRLGPAAASAQCRRHRPRSARRDPRRSRALRLGFAPAEVRLLYRGAQRWVEQPSTVIERRLAERVGELLPQRVLDEWSSLGGGPAAAAQPPRSPASVAGSLAGQARSRVAPEGSGTQELLSTTLERLDRLARMARPDGVSESAWYAASPLERITTFLENARRAWDERRERCGQEAASSAERLLRSLRHATSPASDATMLPSAPRAGTPSRLGAARLRLGAFATGIALTVVGATAPAGVPLELTPAVAMSVQDQTQLPPALPVDGGRGRRSSAVGSLRPTAAARAWWPPPRSTPRRSRARRPIERFLASLPEEQTATPGSRPNRQRGGLLQGGERPATATWIHASGDTSPSRRCATRSPRGGFAVALGPELARLVAPVVWRTLGGQLGVLSLRLLGEEGDWQEATAEEKLLGGLLRRADRQSGPATTQRVAEPFGLFDHEFAFSKPGDSGEGSHALRPLALVGRPRGALRPGARDAAPADRLPRPARDRGAPAGGERRGAARAGTVDARGGHHPPACRRAAGCAPRPRRGPAGGSRRTTTFLPCCVRSHWDFGSWLTASQPVRLSWIPRTHEVCASDRRIDPNRSCSGGCRSSSCCAGCCRRRRHVAGVGDRAGRAGARERAGRRKSSGMPLALGMLPLLAQLPDWVVQIAQGTLVTGVVAGIVWLAAKHGPWASPVRARLVALGTAVALALTPVVPDPSGDASGRPRAAGAVGRQGHPPRPAPRPPALARGAHAGAGRRARRGDRARGGRRAPPGEHPRGPHRVRQLGGRRRGDRGLLQAPERRPRS